MLFIHKFVYTHLLDANMAWRLIILVFSTHMHDLSCRDRLFYLHKMNYQARGCLEITPVLYHCRYYTHLLDTNMAWRLLFVCHRRASVGRQAFRVPSQGLESSSFCWFAWQRFAQKEGLFHRHR